MGVPVNAASGVATFAGRFVLMEKLHAIQCAAQQLLGQFAADRP